MPNRKKLFLIILSSLIFSQFLIFAPAKAVTTGPATPPEFNTSGAFNPNNATAFVFNIPVGQLTGCQISAGGKDAGNNCLGLYIRAWYGFLLGSIGIIATVMIMVGGVEYLTSRGDKGQIDSAKQRIIAAITGIVLAFGSYTILNLINPQLLTITMPSLPFIVDKSEYDLASVGTQESAANKVGGGLAGLPTPGGPNILPTTKQIETDINTATGASPTNDYRPNDGKSNHANGSAVDYPRTNKTNAYFNQMISGQQSTFDYNGQPGYVLHNITIGSTVYPEIRIINETVNNCWHIDQGKK